MDIGEVLSRAWNIIWKYKVLWIFGLLAGLAGGGGGNSFNYNMQQQGQFHMPVEIPAWVVLLLFVLFLVLLIVFVILSALGRAGLVRGAWLADGGETDLTFSRLFREGQAYFGRVLLLGILVGLATLFAVLLMIVPGTLTCGLGFLCLVPFFIIVSAVVELAVIAIVGEDLSVMDGLNRAWAIIRANVALIIAVGLVIVIGSAVVGFLVTLPMLAIAAPAIIALNSGSVQFGNGGLIVSFFLFLLYLPILLAANGIITAYVETAWTVAFRRLTGRPAGSITASSAAL